MATIAGSRTDWVERAEWIHPRVALLEVYWREADLVALYLVEGRRRLLIDTGTTDTPEKAFGPALVRLDRRLDQVDLVVNTHAHIDHAWCKTLERLSRRLGVDVRPSVNAQIAAALCLRELAGQGE